MQAAVDTNEPVALATHPTYLAWTHQRETSDNTASAPVIYGLLALEKSTSRLTEHRLLDSDEVQEGRVGRMEAHLVIGRDFSAVTTSGERAVFVRSDHNLHEFGFNGSEWVQSHKLLTTSRFATSLRNGSL
jgi:hypothetical protein